MVEEFDILEQRLSEKASPRKPNSEGNEIEEPNSNLGSEMAKLNLAASSNNF